MAARPLQPSARAALLAGAGVTTLAALFVSAPIADAKPVPSGDRVEPDATTTTTGSSTTTEPAPTPDYGFQKYRVGVQVKDGSYVPDGTTTVGTVLTITETGPDIEDGSQSTTCTTDASTVEDGSTASYCLAPQSDIRAARRAAGTTDTPFDPVSAPRNEQFYAGPGTTVTITQKTVNPNLVIDPSVGTISPCESDFIQGVCTVPIDGGESLTIKGTSVVFNDPGLPPVATDDSATTEEGVAVDIAIKPNDTANAPIKSVAIVADAKHGTARLVTGETPDPVPSTSAASSSSASASTPDLTEFARQPAGSRKLSAVSSYRAIYTPKAGFTGVDTFDYTITTANGSSTARVTVTVTGTAASSSGASGSGVDADTDSRDDLAATGVQTEELVGYGALLLAVGGGALAVGRRRRRGRHAH